MIPDTSEWDHTAMLASRAPSLEKQESELAALCAMPGVLAAIYVWDEERDDFQARYWSEALASRLGMTQEQARGLWFRETPLSEITRERWVHHARECLRTDQPVSCEFAVDPDEDESEWYTATLSRVHRTEGPPILAWLAVNITDRKRLEEQFLHAQKTEAMGRLASGVAHDFANLLTIIRVSAALMAERGPRTDMDEFDLSEIRNAVDRADAMTKQLLAFARRRHEHASRVDVGHAVRASETMLQRLLGRRHDLVVATCDEEAPVLIDLRQLEQALANLVVNARDAMPEQGTVWVRVTTRCSSLGERPRVELSVRDTGAGIPAEIRPHVFEPFFTTKGEGMGTGLGLSTVMGIVTHAGGTVAVDSVVGIGTTFTLTFPMDGDFEEGVAGHIGLFAEEEGSRSERSEEPA